MLLSEIEAIGFPIPNPLPGHTYPIHLATPQQGTTWINTGAGLLCNGHISHTNPFHITAVHPETAIWEHLPEMPYPAALDKHIRTTYDGCKFVGNKMHVYQQENGYTIEADFYGDVTELMIRDNYVWRTKIGYDHYRYYYGKYSIPAWLLEKITGQDEYMKYELSD